MDVIQKLIGVVARAFYDDQEIVILDLLSRNHSMRDDELAGGVALTIKQLQKSAGKLKEAGLLKVETRWEEIKKKDEQNNEDEKLNTVAASMGSSYASKKDIRDRKKIQRSYFYIDHRQFVNVVKYKIHRIDRIIQKEADSQTRDVPYKCAQCSREYSMLDMLSLAMNDQQIPLCEICNLELAPDVPDVNADASVKLTRFNEEMKPILELLKKTESFSIPASVPLLQANPEKRRKEDHPKEKEITIPIATAGNSTTDIVVELQTETEPVAASGVTQQEGDEEAQNIAKYYESLLQNAATTPQVFSAVEGADDDEDDEVFEAVPTTTSVIPAKRPLEDEEDEDDEEFVDV